MSKANRLPLELTDRFSPGDAARLDAVRYNSAETGRRMEDLLAIAVAGLSPMYAGNGQFVHTMRGTPKTGATVAPEGDNLRYAAIVALGLAFIDQESQQKILDGATARELALTSAERAKTATDTGAIALAAWAAAEAAGSFSTELLERLAAIVARDEVPINTVDCAWVLTAALAAAKLGDTNSLCHRAAKRLLKAQGPTGLFSHKIPAEANGGFRSHVSCFADQVYPIQALARFSVAFNDKVALTAADACAARICALQGDAGQYWWHYDFRNDGVVEGYPVYSVHQHAMGPLALFDLKEAGGTDHWRATVKGVSWLYDHPEMDGELISASKGVIWRKIGRQEPRKAVRSLSAVTTSLRPGLKLPGIDIAFPHNRIDYECRPYEFGWMLYAWLADGVVKALSKEPT